MRGSIDLSRLNDAERRVLRLLVEGHTAKSIANTIGSPPAAVNERLREARRKTGVGSSRELARLLNAQENGRDCRPKNMIPSCRKKRAQQALQQNPFIGDLVKLGLKPEVSGFTGAKDKLDRVVFLLYYSRADAKPK